MLPLAYQTPAAIVLLVGGLVACFAGYRLFKLVLAVYGFLLGAAMASAVVGSGETWWMVAAAIAGGLIGALILVAAYFIGVAIIGAGLGALAVNLVSSQLGNDPHPVAVIAGAVVGALGALALQRYVIIVGTAFGGAWTAVVGGLAMRAGPGRATEQVWLAYPASLGEHRWLIVGLWLALSMVGVIVQFRFTGRGKKSAPRVRKNTGKKE